MNSLDIIQSIQSRSKSSNPNPVQSRWNRQAPIKSSPIQTCYVQEDFNNLQDQCLCPRVRAINGYFNETVCYHASQAQKIYSRHKVCTKSRPIHTPSNVQVISDSNPVKIQLYWIGLQKIHWINPNHLPFHILTVTNTFNKSVTIFMYMSVSIYYPQVRTVQLRYFSNYCLLNHIGQCRL